MIKIYHNPRCSKSREGLQILEDSGKDYEVVLYLENPPTKEELRQILTQLKIRPIDLVRKGENIWKENFRGKEMDDEEILTALSNNPKLIERPIVITGTKAVIGRPPELIKNIV